MSNQSMETFVNSPETLSDEKEFPFINNSQGIEFSKDKFQPKIKVLLLDCSDASLGLLKNEIEKDERIKVIGMARNAHEARNMVVALDPDLLIMDILGPHSGGIEFIKRLNRFYPKPVLLLTPLRKMPSDLAISAFEAGVADLIDKDTIGLFDGISTSEGFSICKKIREMAS